MSNLYCINYIVPDSCKKYNFILTILTVPLYLSYRIDTLDEMQ